MAKQTARMTAADYDSIVEATVASLMNVAAKDVTVEHLEEHAGKFAGLGQRAACQRHLRKKRRKRQMEAQRTRFEATYFQWTQAGRPLERVYIKDGILGLLEVE